MLALLKTVESKLNSIRTELPRTSGPLVLETWGDGKKNLLFQPVLMIKRGEKQRDVKDSRKWVLNTTHNCQTSI